MQVEMWRLERVKPYPGNPRRNERAVAKVVKSIRAFGWRQPIVVDEDGVILAGHTRHLAALELQCEEVPVHVATGLTPAQTRAYRLMDNRAHEEALWDEELLAREMAKILELDGSGELSGFDDDEVARLLGQIDAAELGEPPPSVLENVQHLESIRSQRRKGNAGIVEKTDTEHYLVIVYANRKAREAAVERLGLPTDERYIDGASVEVRRRVGGQRALQLPADRDLSAAKPNKAGAQG